MVVFLRDEVPAPPERLLAAEEEVVTAEARLNPRGFPQTHSLRRAGAAAAARVAIIVAITTKCRVLANPNAF